MKQLIAVIALAVLLVAANSVFVVRENETALLFQFSRIAHRDYVPGLYFKLPFVQEVRKFDRRVLSLDSQPERYLTSEKKSVSVDFFVKWRIADVSRFYTATVGDEARAEQLLNPIVKDALRVEFNTRELHEVIVGGRSDITERVRSVADRASRESFGIEVVDVRIKRIELPDEVSESVFNRMRAERKQVANDLRSRGVEAGERIRSDADRQRQVLLAEANRDAQKIRGEGDAKAAERFAATYGKDPEFYAFYRSLEAYREAFRDGGILLLDPKSEFFRYFGGDEQR